MTLLLLSRYEKTEKSTTFKVTRYDTVTTLTIGDVFVGNAVPVTATVTAQGSPLPVNGEIKIAGTRGNYTIPIINGAGSISIPNLPANSYVVSCTIKRCFYEV